jgi:hypothetical protein
VENATVVIRVRVGVRARLTYWERVEKMCRTTTILLLSSSPGSSESIYPSVTDVENAMVIMICDPGYLYDPG